MSVHTDKAWRQLRDSGAMAGALSYGQWNTLASLSKRELIEIALRLGGLCTLECDDAALAYDRVLEERDALRENSII